MADKGKTAPAAPAPGSGEDPTVIQGQLGARAGGYVMTEAGWVLAPEEEG